MITIMIFSLDILIGRTNVVVDNAIFHIESICHQAYMHKDNF